MVRPLLFSVADSKGTLDAGPESIRLTEDRPFESVTLIGPLPRRSFENYITHCKYCTYRELAGLARALPKRMSIDSPFGGPEP